ncbi:hypothetical protein ACP4OV_015115 [Aristida adscensionis]
MTTAAVKSLVSRAMQRRRRCKPGGGGAAAAAAPVAAAGCFPVYVGPERTRFAVRAERANHPLFRRLLDDAERDYGRAPPGPLALPGCDVAAFLDVLWRMEHDGGAGGDDEEEEESHMVAAASSSPMCGLPSSTRRRGGGKGAGAYRMLRLSPRSVLSPLVRRMRG